MEETENTKQTNVGYKEGAIAGGLIGFVLAASLRKNILIGAIIGMIGGGYIGYMAKNPESQPKFIKPKN